MVTASGDLNQCSVCFFTSDDFEFFLRHLCVDDNGKIAPPDAPISKLKTNQNDLNNKLLRRIPLNVRAISAKNIYQKTTHSTVTF